MKQTKRSLVKDAIVVDGRDPSREYRLSGERYCHSHVRGAGICAIKMKKTHAFPAPDGVTDLRQRLCGVQPFDRRAEGTNCLGEVVDWFWRWQGAPGRPGMTYTNQHREGEVLRLDQLKRHFASRAGPIASKRDPVMLVQMQLLLPAGLLLHWHQRWYEGLG